MLAADQTFGRGATLSALRASIAHLERGAVADPGTISLYDPINRHLPAGGLARGALHEVLAAHPGAAAAFCAIVLARAAGEVLWIDPAPDIWPPGLTGFGLGAANLVVVQAPKPSEGLWAFEEALRSPAVGAAVLVVRGAPPDMVASRRLQLAVEAGGGVGLLLLPDMATVPPSTARTRWRVGSVPGEATRFPRWHLSLLRCIGGGAGSWNVGWDVAAKALTATPSHQARAMVEA